ncbi:YbbR-like domain-containing protein [Siansivirga zeaxanthinifaciens]|uniref:YbbR-like domain-containing protein n=1 Tax=Siansivirga zeaxanthinifaciens CC-SAMT-1 TaxID=1454006 RepID=A0A0C5WNR0_9FLAO|nr:hypothetical protein [Siansivirga zeaxanthinifaciens]AJR04550.1 hypothetical protein AW14_13805 [Siansivirga zeaxanthinifaciens CC-SAMT-1]
MFKKELIEVLAFIRRKKINVFFLFLLLAFVILLFTKLSKTYTNTLAFNIEKLNVPEADLILDDSVNLNITLKTHGFKWLTYYFSKPKIVIDFKNDVYKRDSVFVWHKSVPYVANTQFDKQVELLNMSPDTLYFRYDVNMVKKVSVKLNSKIQYSLGYDLADHFKLTPDSIVVIGPKIKVDSIKYIETKHVVLEEVKSDINKTVDLNLSKNDNDLKYSNTKITLKGTVDKFTEGILKIPVTIINVPDSISVKYFPKEINVSYYVSLGNFNKITTKDFKVVCDYNKILKNQSFLVAELVKVPKIAKKVKVGQQRIEFIITK